MLESAITVAPSDKKKRANKKKAKPALSSAGDDVRIKSKPAGGKRKAKKQTTIESSYAAGAKKARTTSSGPIQRAADPSSLTSHRESSSQAPRRRQTVTNTALPQAREPSSTTSVTPSPVPQFSVSNDPAPQHFRAQPTRTQKAHRPRPAPLGDDGTERLRGNRNSKWRTETRAQSTLQRNALHQKKDRSLFSSYAYDPNDMESVLTSSATKSLSPYPSASEESVLPPHTFAPLSNRASASKTRSFGSSGRKGRARGGKGRRTRNFPSVPPQELLSMKAREQEAYAGLYRQSPPPPPPPRQQYADSNDFYEPPSNESIFPNGHDMRGQFGYEYAGPPGYYEPHPNNAHGWTSGGLVSQSQQMYEYSQDGPEFGYDQPNPNYFLHASSAFDPVTSQPRFSQMDEVGYAYDNNFYQPEMNHQASQRGFPNVQSQQVQQGFQPPGPNQEQDDLFQAAFG